MSAFLFFISFNIEQRRDITHLRVYFLRRIPKEVLFELSLSDEDGMPSQWLGSVKQVVRKRRRK